jgi:hypothetical protein
LQSLERQTCKNFKLFIGNDASPENPENLIKETLKTTDFIYKEYTLSNNGKDASRIAVLRNGSRF